MLCLLGLFVLGFVDVFNIIICVVSSKKIPPIFSVKKIIYRFTLLLLCVIIFIVAFSLTIY